jgi:hypothetical protein
MFALAFVFSFVSLFYLLGFGRMICVFVLMTKDFNQLGNELIGLAGSKASLMVFGLNVIVVVKVGFLADLTVQRGWLGVEESLRLGWKGYLVG